MPEKTLSSRASRGAAFALLTGLALLACSTPPEQPASPAKAPAKTTSPSAPPAPAANIFEVFEVHLCATCHKGGLRFKKKDFDLAPEVMEENLAGRLSDQAEGMKLIEPGDPERSYLFHKLRGTHGDVGGFGRPMPSFTKVPTLTREELEIVRLWIKNKKP